jgi:hypothetical protein
MAKNTYIRQEHIEAICRLIHGWDKPKINWEAVCAEATNVLGYQPSRSGLSSHDAIVKAFQARKLGLKVRPPDDVPKPSSLAQAAHVIAARDAEIAALKLENDELHEKFARWQYNAHLHRVTIDMLEEPLPEPDLIKVQGVNATDRR